MKNLLLSSLFVLIISCSKHTFPGKEYQEIQTGQSTLRSPFASGAESYFFKTSSDIYGHYLSGLLLVKRFPENHYRVIFTTEVGIKLFDFEFAEDSMTVHYCMDKLNRKPVIKVLEKDFRLLFLQGIEKKRIFTTSAADYIEYSWMEQKETIHCFVNRERSEISKIHTTSQKGKSKVWVEMQDYVDHFPHQIGIVHDNIKLKIELKFIQR